MTERIERSVTVEQSTIVSQAMSNHFENLLDLGAETSQREGCINCTHLALCGIAINTLRSRRQGERIDKTDGVDVNGVKVGPKATEICPGELVENSLSRTMRNDFWLLEADELRDASLEVRAAQAVHLAAQDVRKIINNKIII